MIKRRRGCLVTDTRIKVLGMLHLLMDKIYDRIMRWIIGDDLLILLLQIMGVREIEAVRISEREDDCP